MLFALVLIARLRRHRRPFPRFRPRRLARPQHAARHFSRLAHPPHARHQLDRRRAPALYHRYHSDRRSVALVGMGRGLAMGLTTLVSAFTSDVMKIFFGRFRPDLVAQLDPITSPAFPSGHANNAAVVYILFIMLVPQARHPLWQLAAAAMILLTGLSRIMLGVHWPTDVIGGWMLGTSFALMAGAVIAHRQHQRQGKFPSVLAP